MKEQLTAGFIILGGAVFWATHFMVAYFVGEFACVAPGSAFVFFRVSATTWIFALASALFLALTLYDLGLSWRRMKTAENHHQQFIGQIGMFGNSVFALSIVAQTFPAFFLLKGC